MENYLDPRGIRRKILIIDQRFEAVKQYLECGHIAYGNPVFDYSQEIYAHCLECLKLEEKQ